MIKHFLLVCSIALTLTAGAFAQKMVKTNSQDVTLLKLSFEQGNWSEVNRLLAANSTSADSTLLLIKYAYGILTDTTNKNVKYSANKLNYKCVSIDGTPSLDPRNTNVTYIWTMPNGEEKEGLMFNYCFAEAGVQKVKLTFKDNSSEMKFVDDTTLYITIQAPEANIIGGSVQNVNTVKQYSANSIYTTDAQYVWNTDNDNYYIGKNVKIKYDREGAYKLTCYIKNKKDATKPTLIVTQRVTVGKGYVRGSTIVSTVNEHMQEKSGSDVTK